MSTPRTLHPAAPAPSLNDQHKRYLLSVAGYANIELTAPDWPSAWDVVANSIRLRVLEWGRDNRDTVIFLHGGSLTSHTWDLACASLSAEYRCVAIDLRGHGDSEWPADADYRLEAIAADIEGVIDVMADTAPILVGMSLGGLAAIHVAARRNDTIRGLVLVDIGPKQSSAGVEEIQRFSELPHVSPSFDEFGRAVHGVQSTASARAATPEPAQQCTPAARWHMDLEVGQATPGPRLARHG